MKALIFSTILITLSCNNPFYELIDDTVNEFNYETLDEVVIEIDTLYSNVPIDIYYGNQKRLRLFSDSNGYINGSTTLPDYVNEVELKSDFIGIPHSIIMPVTDNRVRYKYFSTNQVTRVTRSNIRNNPNNRTNYQVLGTWDNNGVPDYIISRENMSEDFISVLNSVLPENQPVPEYNPQYLSDGAVTNIDIVEDGEVFVTFIHEGAGYKNSLLFFTYNTVDGAPNSVSSEDLTIIYPNLSYSGGGGGLLSGDTVKIGEFTAGTTIAWALIADGFENGTVRSGENIFYSIDELNIEDSPHNQHVVQIAFDDMVVSSFEDLRRPGGDNDFNDAIFSVTSNPITAIDREGIVLPEESPTIDSDGDGIIDLFDSFPMDNNLSGISYYPSEGSYGTLAFEDLWPHMGDYDFNDLVIDLRFEEYTNSAGDIVTIKAWFEIQGILAGMNNGFAIELGITPEKVLNTIGGDFSKNYIVRNINGTEERQSKAVIGIFEEANRHFVDNVGSVIEVTINMVNGVSREELGYPPYNPFIMSNGERGREVHLPGKQPTDLVHSDYFNSIDDNSNIGSDNTYKTEGNRPWALNLPVSFNYPKDDIEIFRVYNYYDDWVESLGESNSDWFLDLDNYINHNMLFVK